MTNIHELERQWKRYKIKQYKPYIFVSLAIGLIASAVSIFIQPTTTPVVKPVPIVATLPKKAVIKPKKEEIITPVIEELRPSFDFMQNIGTAKHEKRVKRPTTSHHKSVSNYHKPSHAVNTYVKPSLPKSKLAIFATSKKNKMGLLEKRFRSSKNPNLGMVIVKYYYDNNAYSKAYQFALEVNTIDRSKEKSWLYAAKSLYLSHKRNQAIQLLRSYIKRSRSDKASKLLRTMQKGNFK